MEIERPPVGIKMPLAQGDWKAAQASTLKSRPRRRPPAVADIVANVFQHHVSRRNRKVLTPGITRESSCQQMCTTSYVVAETDLTRQQVTQMTIVPTLNIAQSGDTWCPRGPVRLGPKKPAGLKRRGFPRGYSRAAFGRFAIIHEITRGKLR